MTWRRVLSRPAAWLAITRQGALAAARAAAPARLLTPLQTMAMLLGGSTLIGIGVSAFRRADHGLPPYDVLLSAIDKATPLSHGQAGWAVSGALMLVAVLLGSRPNRAGLLFVVVIGVVVDGSYQVIGVPEGQGLRIAYLLGGTLLISGGTALVVHSGSTGGSFELLTDALQSRGFRPSRVRTAVELSVLTAGLAAGGDAGAATVLFAVSVGPILRLSGQALADHRSGRRMRTDASRVRVEALYEA